MLNSTSKFKKDLARAELHQERIKSLLESSIYNCVVLDEPSCKEYDIAIEVCGKRMTAECKEDLASQQTGNFFCEFECTGKLSGISTTTSNYYVVTMAVINGEYKDYIIPTYTLRKLIAHNQYYRQASGGDNGTVKGYLFDVMSLINHENVAELY